jgi:hypothetical protein
MEYQPERYLKGGKLNPDMMDRDSVAFGYGRRCVYPTYLPIYISDSWSFFPVFVLEDTLATPRYT